MTPLNEVVVERVLGVLKNLFSIPTEMLDPVNWQEPLTGQLYNFSSTELIYLLFELEVEFKIRVPVDALSEYRFCSIAQICAVIQKLI